MKLSTRGRYGVRLMLDLAASFGQRPVILKDISSRQGISEKYLWQLVSLLKDAGLVNSSRGTGGGYSLSRSPHDITLKDIVVPLEGPVCLVDCVDKPSVCKRSKTCVPRDIWQEASNKIAEVLASITLENMIERQKNKLGALSYSI